MRRGERGFTLIEVMVALMIVATTCAALQGISSASMRAAFETNHIRVAKMLLRAKAEEIAAGVETGQGGTFEEQGFRGYAWVAQEQQLQAGQEESVRAIQVVLNYPTQSAGSSAASYFADTTIGDAPGTMTVTIFLDPVDAQLAPPKQ